MKAFVSIPKGIRFDTFFTSQNIALAESLGDIVWNNESRQLREDELAEKITDCDVYIALWGSPALTDKVLQKAKNLKLITVLGSTVSPFVSDAMWDRGIRAISALDYFAESTAEGAIAYMLASLRRIPFYSQRLKADGVWCEPHDRTEGLIKKSVGIVGYGAVGKHLARMLSVFNVAIKVYDIKEIPEEDRKKYGLQPCSIEEIFSECDVISLHVPHNKSTHHIIDERLISMIKPGALIVNTARGGIVDQAVLTERLRLGDIKAALDVFEVEPIDGDDELLGLDNALLIPHQAGVTTDLRAILTADLLIESARFIDCGAPLKNEISRAYAMGMSDK